ncbi:trypsin-like peptidase domain-containing protein [Microbispora sp. RL4-1S]|uniref:Trypsin-like peptidase domain-containing protein n=1 Tax=Microbispora oryzae TaxID=2806554 RepID=A0A940WN12_9ACTN|nr:trypsin-like peptidase domain-containing protein [Microbispora oryzae]MBP2708694.1 trypsin-like peptidase domain-containing protein [Microbispora oryzae]
MHISQVLEVICDQGEGVGARWSVGSGYLVDDGVVLTAAHVVANAEAVSVRFNGGVEYEGTVLLCTPPEIDLALVAVKAGPMAGQPAVFGWVSRERPGRIGRGRAVGFPRFKEISRAGRRLRDSVQVDGYVPTADGMVSGYLTFRVDAHPATLDRTRTESAWSGMSGAAVFAGDILVGVVSEHHLAEGQASLTVAPFDRLDLADEPVRRRFWELLVVDDPSRLTRLEPDPAGLQRGPLARIMALPPSMSDFTGRDDEVADVIDRVSRVGVHDRVVVIWGQPGVGKSQLAVEVAHRLFDRHLDGACHVDLQGYSANRLSAEQVATRLLEALAPELELPTEPSARFVACRDVLRRGRYVVVLDNASSSAQIRELLPGPCDTVVLVTSRSSLTTVDAALVEVDVLDTASAIALIRSMVDRDGESRCRDDAEVSGLVRLCGLLPLALRIAGALLRARPAWTVEHLARRLADENRRLHLLKRDDLAVRPVFESG